eukprot:14741710-Heterocapsa_arctica.AAC.1
MGLVSSQRKGSASSRTSWRSSTRTNKYYAAPAQPTTRKRRHKRHWKRTKIIQSKNPITLRELYRLFEKHK